MYNKIKIDLILPTAVFLCLFWSWKKRISKALNGRTILIGKYLANQAYLKCANTTLNYWSFLESSQKLGKFYSYFFLNSVKNVQKKKVCFSHTYNQYNMCFFRHVSAQAFDQTWQIFPTLNNVLWLTLFN